MKKSFSALCAFLVLGLPVAGCGGGDDNNSDTGSAAPASTTQTTKSGGSGGASAKSTNVTMKDISFQPSSVTVPKGGTVTWTNEDTVGHDVTQTGGPGPKFKSGGPGGLNNGDTFKHTFNTPGTIKYVCTVHPGMAGTVIVK
jgi:plastocyanin